VHSLHPAAHLIGRTRAIAREKKEPLMAGQYATETTVTSDRSRNEIERTLIRYGATSFATGWDHGRAAVIFEYGGRRIRFVLTLPDPTDRAYTKAPNGRARTSAQATAAYEQAVRQRWRALSLIIKAKLEAVASGLITFEEEFFSHVVLPNGNTVFEEVAPAVDQAYTTGVFPPVLQIGSGH
jgi:hypothetical protein